MKRVPPLGRIATEEIEYLMTRTIDEDEAISAIVLGLLKVRIEQIPPNLEKEIDQITRKTDRGFSPTSEMTSLFGKTR